MIVVLDHSTTWENEEQGFGVLAMLPLVSHQGSSLIGVGVSVCGNILISLALNVQKLAHQRYADPTEQAVCKGAASSGDDTPDGRMSGMTRLTSTQDDSARATEHTALIMVSPSLAKAARYTNPLRAHQPADVVAIPIEAAHSTVPKTAVRPSQDGPTHHERDEACDDKDHGKIDQSHLYLRSKMWWLGLILLICGEAGNFASYGFAPASVVAPLGSFALISNCFVAPWLLGERFRWRDLQGIALCILGASIVVVSSKQSDDKLNPDELLHAVSEPIFIAYAIVSILSILGLAYVSRSSLGERFVLIDLGVCALTGGFTVLSAKALASFLQLFLLDCLKIPLTYPVILILAATAVIQVNYLNKALQRFDSRQVVPTQFVCFTISAIVGSAVLYREFENTSFSKVLNFLFGCVIVFSGVYTLTRDDEPSAEGMSDPRIVEDRHKSLSSPNHLSPLRVNVISRDDIEDQTPSKSPAMPFAPMRLRRSPSTFSNAPRTLSASAGYLLIASSSGHSPQRLPYHPSAEALLQGSPSKRSLQQQGGNR